LLNYHTKHLTVLTSTHISPHTACIWQWMLMGGIFSTFKNAITARCLHRVSSQPSISTGTEPELWIIVVSKLHMVEGRYHMTAWIRFYSVFFTPIQIMKEKAKLFSRSSYLYVFSNNFESKCLSSEWEMLVQMQCFTSLIFHMIQCKDSRHISRHL
jgi:hypothetical protein